MTYDICYQKCPFFRRVEDPKIGRKKVVQKSGAKKWCKKVGTRLSVQGVIDFCSDLDKVNRPWECSCEFVAVTSSRQSWQ